MYSPSLEVPWTPQPISSLLRTRFTPDFLTTNILDIYQAPTRYQRYTLLKISSIITPPTSNNNNTTTKNHYLYIHSCQQQTSLASGSPVVFQSPTLFPHAMPGAPWLSSRVVYIRRLLSDSPGTYTPLQTATNIRRRCVLAGCAPSHPHRLFSAFGTISGTH